MNVTAVFNFDEIWPDLEAMVSTREREKPISKGCWRISTIVTENRSFIPMIGLIFSATTKPGVESYFGLRKCSMTLCCAGLTIF